MSTEVNFYSLCCGKVKWDFSLAVLAVVEFEKIVFECGCIGKSVLYKRRVFFCGCAVENSFCVVFVSCRTTLEILLGVLTVAKFYI